MIWRILALWLLLANSAIATDIFNGLTSQERRDVHAGELIVKSLDTQGRPGSVFEVYKLMPVSLPILYKTLACFNDYPNFMPNVGRIDVKPKADGSHEADYYLELPMSQRKRYRVSLRGESDGRSARLAWKLIPWPGLSADETIKDTQGYWRLQATAQGQTQVKYHVYTDPGKIPFGLGWIVDILTRVSLPDVLENTEAHAVSQKSFCLK